jgi:Cys-tRNA(Pro) deacylase
MVAPVFYAFTRYAWALGFPLGMSEEELRRGQATGMWISGAFLATFGLVGVVLTLGLVQRWGEAFPRWMIGLAGRRVPIALAVVPGDQELDQKALARLAGDRKVDTVPLKEVQPLTGYLRGGVTALACKKDYPVFADETIELFDVVSVSAGVRGTQIFLAPGDYLRAVRAKVGPIARPKDG